MTRFDNSFKKNLLLFSAIFFFLSTAESMHADTHYDDGGIHNIDTNMPVGTVYISNRTTVNVLSGGNITVGDITGGDVTHTSGIKIYDGMLNVYGGSITGGDVTGGDLVHSRGIYINDGMVNVYGGSITGGDVTGGHVVYSFGIVISNDGMLNVYGGSFTGGNITSCTNGAASGINIGVGTVNIYDGSFTGGIGGDVALGIGIAPDGTANIYGGSFMGGTGSSALDNGLGTVNIYGGSFTGGTGASDIRNGGTLKIYGTVFNYDFGLINATSGTLTGTLADGTLLNVTFERVLHAEIILVHSAYSGGAGTEADPYQITKVSDWKQLMNTSSDWDKYFIMIADVNLQGVALTPVGNSGIPFVGVFDGNGHTISNTDMNMPDINDIGLFGYITSGQIHNLCMENVNINGHCNVGGLVGVSGGGVSNCYSTGSVIGAESVGGLVGENLGLVSNCYSTGFISGVFDVGGLLGDNEEDGIVSNCYSIGSVSGYADVGGLVGDNAFGSLSNCFWDTDTQIHGVVESIGNERGGKVINVAGLPTAQMQTMSTFSAANWDFVEIWNIGENQTYPYLRAYLPSDINKDGIVNFLDFCIVANKWMEQQ